MRTMAARAGCVPSLPAVLVFYALLIATVLSLGDPAKAVVGVLLSAVFIGYCVARPDNRGEVFGLGWAPGPIGGILGELGISPAWAFLFLLISLPVLWGIDREPATAAPEESSASSAAPA
jgi:hypothetical protein